jgi:hypothetical protein
MLRSLRVIEFAAIFADMFVLIVAIVLTPQLGQITFLSATPAILYCGGVLPVCGNFLL